MLQIVPSAGSVSFPSTRTTCAVTFLTSLSLNIALYRLLSRQLCKRIPMAASGCLSEKVLQQGLVVKHQILVVHLLSCLFTSPMLEEDLSHMMFVLPSKDK